MGFLISENQRQHINLSEYAWRVIESDMFNFHSSDIHRHNVSGFLNQVFEHYVFEAEATLSLQEERYGRWLDSVSKDTPMSEGIKNALIEAYLRDMQQKRRIKDKGSAFKFRLNNDNYRFLVEESNEDKYYEGSSGLYLKALFEEYARLPYHKRESVFFMKTIQTIKDAIEKRRQLRIETDKHKSFFVSPYRLTLDPIESFNYLVGYVEGRLVSFRVSKIVHLRLYKSKPSKITKDLAKNAEQALIEEGPQFLAGDHEDIVVRLTEKGIENYHHQIHMRPEYVRIEDGHIYHFRCSRLQALFYFFKFGREVEVLRPKGLRDMFKHYYETALQNYLKN